MKLYRSLSLPTSAFTITAVLLFAMLGMMLFSHKVATAGSFNAAKIMDDSVFTSHTSLTVGQIQTFLNSKVPTCDTDGSEPHGSTTRAAYGRSRGYPPPYTCLKNYNKDGKTGAQLIYEAARDYRINPKVLIVLLQKEQGLVTDDWPWSIQYRSATGYGCPDGEACDSAYYGLKNQLRWAARMFRSIMNANPDWFTPYTVGNNRIYWHPDTGRCGSSTVNIQNRTTAALYSYTPYRPNSAALEAGYGTGNSCSSYGNRNFFRYYSDWFGSTTDNPVYRWSLVSQEAYSDAARTNQISNNLTLVPGEKAYLRIKARNTGNQVWDQTYLRMGTSHPNNRTSPFEDSSWRSSDRPSSMEEAAVQPNGIATFEFSITAPEEFDEYREFYNIAADGRQWLNDPGLVYSINVFSSDPFYAAETVSVRAYRDSSRQAKLNPDNLIAYADESVYMRVRVKNNSNRPLEKATTRLATAEPNNRDSIFYDPSWLSSNRVAEPVEDTVDPGEIATFEFKLTAPDTLQEIDESFGLVVLGTGWFPDTNFTLPIEIKNRPPVALQSGEALSSSEELLSRNNLYRLVMQSNGNLVLRNKLGEAVWQSGTYRYPGSVVTMQADGNLVVRRPGGKAVWASKTAGHAGSVIIMQSDGNLVIRRPGGQATWASGTVGD